MPKTKNVRCYPIQTYQNENKNIALLELYKEYKIFCEKMIHIQYRLYQETGYLNKSIDTKDIPSKLSERYKRCATYQVVGILQSWLSNRDNKIKDMIHGCDSLTSEEKRILHIIKNNNIFYEQTLFVRKEKVLISKKHIQVYKSILRSVKWRLPSCQKISMLLNDNVSKLNYKGEGAKKLQSTFFEAWIELSTLTKGKKSYFPVNINNYVKEKLSEGKRLNSLRIDIKDSKFVFNIMIDKKTDEDYKNKIESELRSFTY